MDRCGKGLSTMPGTQYPLRYPRLVVAATAAVTARESSHQRGKPWSKYLTCVKVCPWTPLWPARKSPRYWFWPLNMGPIAGLEAEMSSSWPRKGLPRLWEGKHIPPGNWEEEQTQPRPQSHHQPWQPTARATVISQTFTDRFSLQNTQGQGAGRRQKTCVLRADGWQVYFPERLL